MLTRKYGPHKEAYVNTFKPIFVKIVSVFKKNNLAIIEPVVV
jgi:hypothetical protein